MDLIALKIELEKGPEGIIYPDFQLIPAQDRRNMHWTKYFDMLGGWYYDKASGFGESDAESPDPLKWHGCVLVEPAFAAEALRLFPDKIVKLTEQQFQQFYENRWCAKQPDEYIDTDIINGIRAKYGIPTGRITAEHIASMDEADRKALDPDDDTPGIKRNKRKRFDTLKNKLNLHIG